MEWDCFTLAKLGNSDAENEDKSYLASNTPGSPSFFALSDGATESAFASEWAEELVRSDWGCLLGESSIGGAAWIARCQASFAGKIESRELPWYARTKIDREGAFATFIGLRLDNAGADAGEWSAVACGDSCLFHISRRKMIKKFPIDRPGGFNNRPILLSSRYGFIEPASLRRDMGKWKAGDHLILATDAVAHWLLHRDQGRDRRRRLLECADQPAFEELVREERAVGRLKNDDSTVIVIRL